MFGSVNRNARFVLIRQHNAKAKVYGCLPRAEQGLPKDRRRIEIYL